MALTSKSTPKKATAPKPVLVPTWQDDHRPQTLKDVAGQSEACRMVHGMFQTGKIPQVILIHGPSGTAKTTLSRIIARRLDPTGRDTFPINASEDTGIDKMRDTIQAARAKPMSGDFKVYCVDEAHGLTKASGSAALDFLEKPPEHVVVVLSTDQIEKMLTTLIDRAVKIKLNPLDSAAIHKILLRVAEKENVFQPADDHKPLFNALAQIFTGSARPAIDTLYRLHLIHQTRPLKREDLAAEVAATIKFDYRDAPKFVYKWYSNDKTAMHVVATIEEPAGFVTLLLNIHHWMLKKAIGMNPPFDYLATQAAKDITVPVNVLHENLGILLDLRSALMNPWGRNPQHILLNGLLKLKAAK